MTEKIIGKKNGMTVLLLTILIIIASVVGAAFGGEMMDAGKSPVLFIISLIVLCTSWIAFPGLKVLKPNEALVLTLFGKYKGTLKGEGFYFVNPFCASVFGSSKTALGSVKSCPNIFNCGGVGSATLGAELSISPATPAAFPAPDKILLPSVGDVGSPFAAAHELGIFIFEAALCAPFFTVSSASFLAGSAIYFILLCLLFLREPECV